MPTYWTAARIAGHVHRAVLAPRGFTRRGRVCEREGGGLRRAVTFHVRTAGPPRVEMLAEVGVTGLPEPATPHRHDRLWGNARTAAGHHWYPLPRGDENLPPGLLADAAGPVADFLTRAADLGDVVLWAQEIFAGDVRPGWWGRFQPVFPQGTGPLQVAAYAACVRDDAALAEFLTARVENEEADEHAFTGFLAEIRRLRPGLRERHPLRRPVRW